MSDKKIPTEKVANIPPFGLRMPADLKEKIQLSAVENNRSMNAEIVQRLEDSFEIEQATHEQREVKEDLRLARLDAKLLRAALDMPSRSEIMKILDEKGLEPMTPEGYQAYLIYWSNREKLRPREGEEELAEKLRKDPRWK